MLYAEKKNLKDKKTIQLLFHGRAKKSMICNVQEMKLNQGVHKQAVHAIPLLHVGQ